ncbi:MAG: CocE/NonD family hydrolase [Candidatus Lokiarchaeota archaeon]|nr:CocE/NonD family hydrolase [Candidatus Lokiarchaeota archaeon]
MSQPIFKFDDAPRRQKKYKGSRKASIYLTMKDGVKIAAEMITPASAATGERFPAVLVQTRYWRAFQFRLPFRWILGDQPPMVQRIIDMATSYGFALVYTDVRGTGASTGTWKNANTEREFADCKEIMDWIVEQPWSDGNILAWGISYLGLTAEFAGIHGHPNLKGVMPMHDYWDVLADVGAPGGVPNTRFLELWSNLGRAMDRNSPRELAKKMPLALLVLQHVKPVGDGADGNMTKAAIKEHEKNVYPFSLTGVIKYRDDPIDAEGTKIDSMCMYKYKDRFERSGVPYYYWGSWLDAGTADVGITRFLNLPNRQRVVIGDWNHGAMSRANQFFPSKRKVVPPSKEQYAEWINYFDRCMAGDVPDERVIYYYTLVEERWKRTGTWPPGGHEVQTWYLSSDNRLAKTPPDGAEGEDEYRVDFNATTGKLNRWGAGLGYRIVYPNRAEQDRRLLTYTSQPLAEDVEITGNAVATIHVSSTHDDGIVIAYLEDVAENGRVTYITEGLLRLIHRKRATGDLPYKSLVHFHTYLRKDGMPMAKGEVAEVTIGMLATSVLVRRGHCIRVAIAGADKDSFARIPETGEPKIVVSRNRSHPSSIQLPVMSRK